MKGLVSKEYGAAIMRKVRVTWNMEIKYSKQTDYGQLTTVRRLCILTK